jgi:hypothetical protein
MELSTSSSATNTATDNSSFMSDQLPVYQETKTARTTQEQKFRSKSYEEDWYSRRQWVKWCRKMVLETKKELACWQNGTQEPSVVETFMSYNYIALSQICNILWAKNFEFQRWWDKQIIFNFIFAQRVKEREKELVNFEYPRLHAFIRHALMHDPDDPTIEIINKCKRVSLMYPYVGVEDMYTLEVGNYKRVSDNIALKGILLKNYGDDFIDPFESGYVSRSPTMQEWVHFIFKIKEERRKQQQALKLITDFKKTNPDYI